MTSGWHLVDGVKVCLLLSLSLSGVAPAVPAEPAAPAQALKMDYGSMLTYTVGLPEGPGPTNADLALKGICVRLGERRQAAICFDTDLLRYYAGWTAGWLDLSRTHLTSYKGSYHALIQGQVEFASAPGPGWAWKDDFSDPRPLPAGPLPRDRGRFLGLYRHENRVVFHYRIGHTEIYETPEAVSTNGLTAFVRTLWVGASDEVLLFRVCNVTSHGPPIRVNQTEAQAAAAVLEGMATRVHVAGPDARVEVIPDGRIQVRLPPRPRPAEYRVVLSHGPEASADSKTLAEVARQPFPDLKAWCAGGPASWPEPVSVTGRLGANLAAYTVDTVPIPEKNPWNSWMRLVAFDFFADGRAAVSTWNGDVWIVSGLDEKLGRPSWRRYAAGLFEPLGLKIVDDQVFVLCRDQLMKLHDQNRDGEADYYECYSNDTWLSPSYHAFAFDLQTDRAGRFYYTRCGQRVDPALPLNGGMVRVSRDGQQSELIATGLRAANGMAIGPNDEIVCSDNQGNWVPASRINWIKGGGFYGYLPHARREPPPVDYEKPICWVPMLLDNSSGGQAWVASDRWGPLQGQLLHTSYGKSALFLVLLEEVEGVKQGGVVQFPLRFESGIMRARFHPQDHQLWVCGLKGWQTSGARDGALQRVRYTGQPVRMPSALHVVSNGLSLTFTCTLDPVTANDTDNYAVEQWNYLWSDKYGSPEFSVTQPTRPGHDPVSLRSARLAPDGRTLFLEIPGLQPVMQMKIRLRLKAADGATVEHDIYNTINRLGASVGL